MSEDTGVSMHFTRDDEFMFDIRTNDLCPKCRDGIHLEHYPWWSDGMSPEKKCLCRCNGLQVEVKSAHDPVNHPSHYTAYKGLEIIDLTEQMNFNRGNAVKYIARAGLKNPESEIQDLEKAAWYVNREIERMKKNRPGS